MMEPVPMNEPVPMMEPVVIPDPNQPMEIGVFDVNDAM